MHATLPCTRLNHFVMLRAAQECHRARDWERRQRDRFNRRHSPYPWPDACAAVLQDEELDPETTAFLIQELARQGCAEVAQAAVLQLRKRVPSPVTRRVLCAALSAAAGHYDPKPALELYRMLRDDDDGGLDLAIANLTLAACSHGGDMDSVMAVLQDMQVRAPCLHACAMPACEKAARSMHACMLR